MQTQPKIHSLRTPISIPLDQLDGPRAVSILRREMDRHFAANPAENNFKSLAADAQLGPKTLSNIYYQITQQPRLLTVVLLMKALGFSAVRFN